MKVRYTLPIRGLLRVRENSPIELGEWSFHFLSKKQNEYVDTLIIEIAEIPKKNWPTFTVIEQDPEWSMPRFPFEVNKNVFH